MNMCAIDYTMNEREIAPIFETNHHLGQFFHYDHWIWILNTTSTAKTNLCNKILMEDFQMANISLH
jgi:hypothetical protein